MADTQIQAEAKRISRSVRRLPAVKRREFAESAAKFDLEAGYKMVLELKDQARLIGDVKAEATCTALLLKMLGYLTDRVQIDSGPNIAEAMREAEARTAALRAPLRILPDPSKTVELAESDKEGVFS